MRLQLIAIGLLLTMFASRTFAQTDLKLMPWPAGVHMGNGEFVIDQSLGIGFEGYREPRLDRAAERFLGRLSRQTGTPFSASVNAEKPNFVIRCDHASEKIQQAKEDESYRLEVTTTSVTLTAPTPLGIMHGLQTFLQLVQIGPKGFTAPAVVIEDEPRFPWRGLLIDVSRHFVPLDDVKRNLDAMEAVKMNVLHWHLSDDQGFRVESKKFPKFQELSSDGKYYTQAQVTELIDYARDRGIRVVPEFDMPGHTTSWFVAYPQLASGPGPYKIERQWGVFDPAMDPTREETYKFLDEFIGEMSKLFPDPYFHVGGDEVNGKQWDANPAIQRFMHERHLKNNAALQSYFNARLQKIVQKHGKRMMGWDEILDPTLPKDIVIQSWRGQESLAQAAKLGYSSLLSNGYYLDLMYPAAKHYGVDPLGDGAANLTPEEKARVLGGEACMWTELVTPENLDGRIWPRAAAVAERLWSPAEIRDVDSMYARLAALDDNLQFLGLKDLSNRQHMLERMAGSGKIGPLEVLMSALEPVKEYARTDSGKYTSATPLNRLVDATPPESAAAREFAKAVQRYLANKNAADAVTLRAWLTKWRDNEREVAPILARSALLKELEPVSAELISVASTGLEALDYQSGGAPVGWKQTELVMLKQAAQPKAELLDQIVPSVQKLVEAVPAQ